MAYLAMTGETIPSDAEGRKKSTVMSTMARVRIPRLMPSIAPVIRLTSTSRPTTRTVRAEAASRIHGMSLGGGILSASLPPIQLPRLMPPSTIPITLVQV